MCECKGWHLLPVCLRKSRKLVSECLWPVLRIYFATVWKRYQIRSNEKLHHWQWSGFIRKCSKRSRIRPNVYSATESKSKSPLLHARGTKLIEHNPTKNMRTSGNAKQGPSGTQLHRSWPYPQLFAKLWRLPYWLKRSKRSGYGRNYMEICILKGFNFISIIDLMHLIYIYLKFILFL